MAPRVAAKDFARGSVEPAGAAVMLHRAAALDVSAAARLMRGRHWIRGRGFLRYCSQSAFAEKSADLERLGRRRGKTT
jgi:hypothetical protein